jgi:RNA 2',3'-cyclic 3'-phosphodiesterase
MTPPTLINGADHFCRVLYPVFSGGLPTGGLPTGGYRPLAPPLPQPWMPRPSDRLSFLIYPSAVAARQMVGLASCLGDQHDLHHRPTEEERLHTTLYSVGCFAQMTKRRFAEIDEAVSNLAMPPFIASYDRVGIFGKAKGKLVLRGDEGVIGVAMLHDELATAMRMIGFRHWERNFTPHVTLNYGECAVIEQQVEEIRWVVSELSLVCSAYGRSKHLVLGQWRLKTPARFH